ncbi:CHAT domain-containing protein [Saccharopolyspora sp. NPDC050389]|uniref:CHAT domain-containing protein n=1 Tax=Saccharopolyspora sp. NPDC050389 TaxID=3155516 RepID=UPI0033E9E513
MTEVPAELTEAIAALREELQHDLSDEQRYHAAIQLVDLLLQRDQLDGAEPNEAIAIADWLASAFDADSPARIPPLYDLCLAHLLRAAHHGEDDLRAAVGYWRQLRQLVTADHPGRAEIYARSALIISDAVVRLADPADFAAAIADLDIAIDELADRDLRRGAVLTRAQLWAARFRTLGGDEADHRRAVATFTESQVWPEIQARDACHRELALLILLKDLPAAERRTELTDEQVRQLINGLPKSELLAVRGHLDALSAELIAMPDVAAARVGVVLAQGAETTPHDWDVLAADLGTLIEHSPDDDPGRHRSVVLRAASSSDPLPAAPVARLAELDESIGALRRKVISDLDGESVTGDLLTISALLLERAALTDGDPAKTIEIATSMAALHDDEPAGQVLPLYQLALAHAMRGDLRLTVDLLRRLRPLLTVDDPGCAEIFARSGVIIAKLVAESDELDHVDDAIADLDAALAGLGDGQLRRNASMARASMQLTRFTTLGGGEDDRQNAIAAFQEALQRTDISTGLRDTCHTGIAFLSLLKNVPAEHRRKRLGADRIDELVGYLDEAELATARRHLAAVSANASNPELAALRLLVWAGRSSEHQDLAGALDDLVTAAEDALDAALTSAELDAVHAIKSALAGDDAPRLISAATAGLPPESPVRLLATMHRLSVDGVEGLSPEDLAELISWQEQQVNAMPDDAPERAEELTALATALVTQSRRDGADSADAMARSRAIAEEVVRKYPSDNIAAGFSHSLLAFDKKGEMDLDSVEATLGHLQRASELLPAEHEAWGDFGPALGGMLFVRFALTGNREDIEAAGYYAPDGSPLANLINDVHSRVAESSIGEPDVVLRDLRPVLEGLMPEERIRMTARITASVRLLGMLPFDNGIISSLRQMDALAGSIDAASDALEPESKAKVADVVASIRKIQQRIGFTGKLDLDAARQALDAAREIPRTRADHATENIGAACLCISFGLAAGDLPLADYGLDVLAELVEGSVGPAHDRHLAMRMLAFGRQSRFGRGMPSDAVGPAIEGMERMVAEFRSESSDFLANDLDLLAVNYRRRDHPGDRERALETNLEALRVRARGVLLQSNPRRAMHAAADAAGQAVRTARRCLEAEQPESAVRALELGRGMVLHAATTSASMPELLRDNGSPELADRWEAEVDRQQPWDTHAERTDPTKSPLPSDLRYKVLHALEDTDAEGKLVSATAISDIAAELRARRTRALVYLIDDEAVLVTDLGTIHRLPCPKLSVHHDAARHFDLLQQELASVGAAVQQPWQAALEAVCNWAWDAALGPVLEWLDDPGTPRIVLVPTGKFTVVPWHAARYRTPGGEVRYACQDVVIAYAASARQFVEAARRHPRPWPRKPVLVRTPELHWTRHELGHIHDAHYPDGSYLGRPGPRRRSVPTPEDVLAALPGASLLHLSCHADQAEIPVESALRLGAGRALPVRDILRQHHENGPHAALVVLAACASDLTIRAHDEVLTLATAFLAAGASGVVGTKWEIDDLATAMFMIVFHHHLNADHCDPAAALRAAQLWMLDDDRRPIPGVPAELAEHFAEIDPAAPMRWAAFTYHGR